LQLQRCETKGHSRSSQFVASGVGKPHWRPWPVCSQYSSALNSFSFSVLPFLPILDYRVGFPCSQTWEIRGSGLRDWLQLEHEYPVGDQIRRISLYLPCQSGISLERRVRYRLFPPPFSPQLPEDLPVGARFIPPSPVVPRALGEGRGEAEPETAGSGPKTSCSPRSSLLPGWAGRIRPGFTPAKGGAQQIYQRPHGSRMVRDRAAQNESVSRNWAGELSASGR
jgi:hypothetical protein